jgi:hypothetical protein
MKNTTKLKSFEINIFTYFIVKAKKRLVIKRIISSVAFIFSFVSLSVNIYEIHEMTRYSNVNGEKVDRQMSTNVNINFKKIWAIICRRKVIVESSNIIDHSYIIDRLVTCTTHQGFRLF